MRESTNWRERAKNAESTIGNERANGDESTIMDERARAHESTTIWERATFEESTRARERARLVESTTGAERAIDRESTIGKERATTLESTRMTERAIMAESTRGIERASPPFRLTAPEPSEQELHESVAALCRQLVAPPAVWAFYPAGGVQLAPFQAAKLTRMGLQRGWPDFIFLSEARIFGIELKAAKGRLSKTRVVRTARGSPRILEGQEDVFPRLREAGMIIEVARSLEEVLAHLEAWRIPLRGRIHGGVE